MERDREGGENDNSHNIFDRKRPNGMDHPVAML
jgi:hypothetical protein